MFPNQYAKLTSANFILQPNTGSYGRSLGSIGYNSASVDLQTFLQGGTVNYNASTGTLTVSPYISKAIGIQYSYQTLSWETTITLSTKVYVVLSGIK